MPMLNHLVEYQSWHRLWNSWLESIRCPQAQMSFLEDIIAGLKIHMLWEYFPYEAFSSRVQPHKNCWAHLSCSVLMEARIQSSSFKENNVAILWNFVDLLFKNQTGLHFLKIIVS